jgi:hypothetical protein
MDVGIQAVHIMHFGRVQFLYSGQKTPLNVLRRSLYISPVSLHSSTGNLTKSPTLVWFGDFTSNLSLIYDILFL